MTWRDAAEDLLEQWLSEDGESAFFETSRRPIHIRIYMAYIIYMLYACMYIYPYMYIYIYLHVG